VGNPRVWAVVSRTRRTAANPPAPAGNTEGIESPGQKDAPALDRLPLAGHLQQQTSQHHRRTGQGQIPAPSGPLVPEGRHLPPFFPQCGSMGSPSGGGRFSNHQHFSATCRGRGRPAKGEPATLRPATIRPPPQVGGQPPQSWPSPAEGLAPLQPPNARRVGPIGGSEPWPPFVGHLDQTAESGSSQQGAAHQQHRGRPPPGTGRRPWSATASTLAGEPVRHRPPEPWATVLAQQRVAKTRVSRAGATWPKSSGSPFQGEAGGSGPLGARSSPAHRRAGPRQTQRFSCPAGCR